MGNQNFTTTLLVNQSPEEVFDAINNVRGWWSGNIEGDTDKLGSEWTYRYKDIHYSKQKITELIPNKKVAWHMLDGFLNFVKDKTEWVGTDVIFDITKKGDKTEVRFTHVGLKPDLECYNACMDGWKTYINGSLEQLITTGIGYPNTGEAITDSEKKLSE